MDALDGLIAPGLPCLPHEDRLPVVWPTWKQAAIATVVLVVVAAITRRQRRPISAVSPFAGETALVSFLYAIWRLARMLPLTHSEGAVHRAEQIWDLEQALHIPSELTIERWVLPHEALANACDAFYATVHVPALLTFLVWMFFRHRDHYGLWRNALAILTGFCLLVRFVRVAPPRLLPHLGFVDMAARYGQSVYGAVGTGVSDQYAAMPSIHVGWAALVGLGAVHASTSRWRWFVLLHPVVTSLVVVATANHWWLDGIVSVALLGLALLCDRAGRKILSRVAPRAVLDGAVGSATGPSTARPEPVASP